MRLCQSLALQPLIQSIRYYYTNHEFNWLTHLWSPLTWWVCFLFYTLAQAQAPHRAQKVSTGLPRLYRGLYSAVLDFSGSTLEASGLVPSLLCSVYCYFVISWFILGGEIDWFHCKLQGKYNNEYWDWNHEFDYYRPTHDKLCQNIVCDFQYFWNPYTMICL